MDRSEFLKSMCLGLTVVTLGGCLNGCASDDLTGPSNVDFTLDLTQSVNDKLNTVGGTVVSNGIIVARVGATEFVAVSVVCTHEGTHLVWQQSNNRFFCSNHGATFSKTGQVTNGPAKTNLRSYNVSVNGSLVHIFS